MDNLEKYLRPQRRDTPLLSAVAMLLMGCAIVLAIQGLDLHQGASLQQERNDRAAAQAAQPAARKPTKAEQEQTRHWSELEAERNFEWTRLFRAVERADSADIELMELAPDKRNRKVLLRGQARNSQALINYIDALSEQQMFKQIYLGHQQTTTKDGTETIAFEIKLSLQQSSHPTAI